jgi:hypothetical protein
MNTVPTQYLKDVKLFTFPQVLLPLRAVRLFIRYGFNLPFYISGFSFHAVTNKLSNTYKCDIMLILQKASVCDFTFTIVIISVYSGVTALVSLRYFLNTIHTHLRCNVLGAVNLWIMGISVVTSRGLVGGNHSF